MRRLSKRQRKGLRTARSCVVCHVAYPSDVDRSTLYVFPDGCTAHDVCVMDDNFDTFHWHTVEARREDDYRQHARRTTP